MIICLERCVDLLMRLPLTVSCFSKIQTGFFMVPAHPGSPGQRAVKRACVCVCVYAYTSPTTYSSQTDNLNNVNFTVSTFKHHHFFFSLG